MATPKPDKAKWDPQRTLLGLKYLGIGTALLTVIIGWRPAQQSLASYVSSRHRQPLPADTVRFVNTPAWLETFPGFASRLQQVVAAPLTMDPLDGQSLALASTALKKTGWIAEVSRIQRTASGIEVHATFRTPAAVVEHKQGYVLVDVNGLLLPGVYRAAHLPQLGLPLITGVNDRKPAQSGQPWPGTDIPAALTLIETLADQPYRGQIQAIDVSSRDNRGRLRMALVTTNGLVRWGLPPGQEHPVEPIAAQKKKWLQDVYNQRGSIDAGGRVVDVSGPAVYIHDSLGLATGPTPQQAYTALR